MKTLLLLAAVATLSMAAHAQSCPAPNNGYKLSQKDYKSMASSKSGLTSEKFLTLKSDDQGAVCQTRAFLNKVNNPNDSNKPKPFMDDMESYSSLYLSPDEISAMSKAANDLVGRLLTSKGIGS